MLAFHLIKILFFKQVCLTGYQVAQKLYEPALWQAAYNESNIINNPYEAAAEMKGRMFLKKPAFYRENIAFLF